MAERKQSRQIESESRGVGFKNRVTDVSKTSYNRSAAFIKRRPMASFFLVLGLLLIILILGKIFEKQPQEVTAQKMTKAVNVYSLGQGPQAAFQAKIEKSGVVKIMAQATGVVAHISVQEGDSVSKGQQLISLSTNYQGGNAQGVQSAIAQAQYKNALDTYGPQLDLISKQKDVATASAEQAQRTRDIAKDALNDTRGLIDTNQSQLDQINQQLNALKATNPTDPDTIQQIGTLQGTAGQLDASLAQLRNSARTADYQSSNANAPALLSNLQKDISIEQLDIQAKGITLNKEVSGLQADLAAISAALMYPASPFDGTVERINVREGQLVNPGAELATVVAPDGKTTAILLVPLAIARTIYTTESSSLLIHGQYVQVTPTHISSEATDGQLYAVVYEIPEDQAQYLTDGEYISVQVPIGAEPSKPGDPLIPIDAVYQNQENAFVLIYNNGKAETRIVNAGNVYGSYVEVTSGLKNDDKIILNRNVVAGDTVKIQ
jgi:multidrug efflux pump subunit AcrA (membrane-fusion protein)